jgi:precorrin-2/cobalt-factor-2 C20-methyltransferase
MKMKKDERHIGKLYGVGTGPGDPELLTLKAVRIINESDVIAVPGSVKEEAVSYKIVKQVIKNIDEKPCLCIDWLMTKDREIIKNIHLRAADMIEEVLQEGKNIAFLTLGDPVVYSTYMYVHEIIRSRGYGAEVVSGVTSFSAAAAALGASLVQGREILEVIPASYMLEDQEQQHRTRVYMKAGGRLGVLKSQTEAMWMVENCGMEDEKIYTDIDEIPEKSGYYSIVITKS